MYMNIYFILQATNAEDNHDDEDKEESTELMAGMLCAAGTVFSFLIIITLIIRHMRKLKRQYRKEKYYKLWQLGSPIYRQTTKV